jgi:hypothetical protein
LSAAVLGAGWYLAGGSRSQFGSGSLPLWVASTANWWSHTSRRTVPLDPSVVAMLRKHRSEQKAERPAALEWIDTGLVLPDETGELVDPRSCASCRRPRSGSV